VVQVLLDIDLHDGLGEVGDHHLPEGPGDAQQHQAWLLHALCIGLDIIRQAQHVLVTLMVAEVGQGLAYEDLGELGLGIFTPNNNLALSNQFDYKKILTDLVAL
jgi:hypothetical protein